MRSSPRAAEMLAGLKEAGFKLTSQRRAIVQLFADDPSHPTAQSIFDRLRASHPTLSFATVYNTLDALSKVDAAGVLRIGGASRFDPNTAPHAHAICDGCGSILDIPLTELPHASTGAGPGALAATHGFEVHAVETTFHGLCRSCRRSSS